jgi:hypothetical protein
VSSEGTIETRERKRVWAGVILNGSASSGILNTVWYTLLPHSRCDQDPVDDKHDARW